MASKGINHSALKLLIESGSSISITALANADQWMLKVAFGEINKTVLAKNSGKARIWRKLDTLAKYLSTLGITTFEIDMTDYDPSKKTLTRPDSARILKQAHDAHKSQLMKNRVAEENSEQAASTHIQDPALKAKANWEERRARILQLENPRVK